MKITLAEDFVRIVDNFIIECTDQEMLDEIAQIDREARLLYISFYDMYCVVLQNVAGHQKLVSTFRTYLRNKK